MTLPVPSTVLVPQLVREAADRFTALLAEVAPSTAEWVARACGAGADTPVVVVVGETKRGKSSLVNALLARPGLSPVDAAQVSGTALSIRYGESLAAWACHPGPLGTVPVEPALLAAWVSAGREPGGPVAPVDQFEVSAPIPLLRRLSLLDTPGVGGLDSAHGDVARQAAFAASAVLFVVDASAPLSRDELTFLRTVADRVETVLFALTKIDQFRGWREVMAADRALLAEHVPRLAGVAVHPVSARMFELAASAPSTAAATALRERSGVADLQVALQQAVAGRAAVLRDANTLRALETGLAEGAAVLAARRRALTGDEAAVEALRARRDDLATQRRTAGRGWPVRLRAETQRARAECLHEAGQRMRDVQAWFRHAVDAAGRAELSGLPEQVDAALRMVSARISAALADRIGHLADTTVAEVFSAAELDEFRARFGGRAQPPVVLRPPERRQPTAEDKLLVFMGISGGLGIGRAAALPLAGLGAAVVNPIVLPVTIVLGLGAGWWMARTRQHAVDKQHMRQWLADAIADARSTAEHLVAEQFIEAERELFLLLDEAVGRRIEAIDGELREVDQALRLDAVARASELERVDRWSAEVAAGRERVRRLLELLG